MCLCQLFTIAWLLIVNLIVLNAVFDGGFRMPEAGGGGGGYGPTSNGFGPPSGGFGPPGGPYGTPDAGYRHDSSFSSPAYMSSGPPQGNPSAFPPSSYSPFDSQPTYGAPSQLHQTEYNPFGAAFTGPNSYGNAPYLTPSESSSIYNPDPTPMMPFQDNILQQIAPQSGRPSSNGYAPAYGNMNAPGPMQPPGFGHSAPSHFGGGGPAPAPYQTQPAHPSHSSSLPPPQSSGPYSSSMHQQQNAPYPNHTPPSGPATYHQPSGYTDYSQQNSMQSGMGAAHPTAGYSQQGSQYSGPTQNRGASADYYGDQSPFLSGNPDTNQYQSQHTQRTGFQDPNIRYTFSFNFLGKLS